MKLAKKSTPPARLARITSLGLGLAALAMTSHDALGAFSYTGSNGGYIVDNGANLVFTVNSGGDISSLLYKGIQVNSSAASGIASGLGASSVTAKQIGNIILITCVSTSVAPSPLTHYYFVQDGVDNIYMADYVTAEPNIGELRFIGRFLYDPIPNGPPDSNNSGNTGAIESQDIDGHANGQTTSKYYGNTDDYLLTVNGATGNGIGVFMAYGSRESSSGGPFYHDIENQGLGAGSDQQIYNYMNSGHNQTDHDRVNVLYGPYAWVFTGGSTPAVPDMSLGGAVDNLGLKGYVNSAGRGRVVLNGLAGMDASFTYLVTLTNDAAQYWTTATPGSGVSELYGVKPGTYTMDIYKGQLVVGTIDNVVVTAGNSTTYHTYTITDDPSTVATIWRIGDWDGTPLEFLNGPLISQMHPSDVRMKKWEPITFTIGSTPVSSFPSVQFRGANSPTTIKFTLSAAQAASAHVLKIGITDAYASGRPDPTINGTALTGPGASAQPPSRCFTTGTFRGNNTTFTWTIPAGDFVAGENTLSITPISGSSDLGPWLSASFSYDCVELDN